MEKDPMAAKPPRKKSRAQSEDALIAAVRAMRADAVDAPPPPNVEAVREAIINAKDVKPGDVESAGDDQRPKVGDGGSGGNDGGDGGGGRQGVAAAREFLLRQFNFSATGLWWQPPDGKDGKKSPMHVCGPIEAVARTRDENGEGHGILLRWSDGDGHQHEFALPRGMLAGDGTSIRQYVLERGLYLSPNRAAREAFMTWLAAIYPTESALSVEQVGWHAGDKGLAFVLPDKVYGPAGGEKMILQTVARVAHNFDTAGNLEDWQREVAALCADNTRLLLAVSAAFAAPLIHVAGEGSAGVNLVGQSSTGKTTAVFVGSSVWGPGRRNGYVKTWRSTSNGLESVAAAHSDCLLALDEIGQVDSREIGEAIYMLMNQAGKARAGRDGGARHVQSWRCLVISSGESSIGELAIEGGKQARAGHEVRLIDIPVDTGSGFGLFEDLHGSPGADEFSRRIQDAAGRWYGTPARAFLQSLCDWLSKDQDAVAAFLKQHRDEFKAAHFPPRDGKPVSGQVSRVAGIFGLISAAGELATQFGITGWKPGMARWGAGLCFRAWLDERGGTGSREDQAAIEKVRSFIEAHGAARFELFGDVALLDDSSQPKDAKIIQRAGFKRYDKETASWNYYIFPGIWKAEVCKGSNSKRTAKLLADRGFLVRDGEGKSTKGVRVPGFVKPVRLYHILGTILSDADSSE